jgi:sensor histidine kinase regulating citrate/malate metabolism
MLSRVYYNLIDNAVRHGMTVTEIRFECSVQDDRLVIVCEDNGTGIADLDRAGLFLQGSGRNTGYGLFLIREILAITGFSIRETGQEGCGARFEITVPPGAFRRSGSVS